MSEPRSPIDEQALAAALAPRFLHEGVDPTYLRCVLNHVPRTDDNWRECCGSNCDPCVEQIGRLVDAARQWLGVKPPPTN